MKPASATVLVSGPYTDVALVSQIAEGPIGIRPCVGLKPKAPQKLAGRRIEPPPSLAVTRASTPLAIAAAEPPLDPPGVRARSHGEHVNPCTKFLVRTIWPNSGVLVFPTTIAPAAFSRATCVESAVARRPSNSFEP